jgi:hypothetical protein
LIDSVERERRFDDDAASIATAIRPTGGADGLSRSFSNAEEQDRLQEEFLQARVASNVSKFLHERRKTMQGHRIASLVPAVIRRLQKRRHDDC